jgi:RHS repeat-associated protein
MRSNIIFAEPHAITLDESGLVAASEPSIKARGKAYGTGRKGSIEWKDGDLYWNQYGIYSDDTEITEGATLVFARVLKTSIVGPETVSSGEYGDLRTSGSDVYKLGQAGTSLTTASATAAADDRPGYLPGQPWRAYGSGPLLSYRQKGIRQYELTDHLGNVRAVIGDRLEEKTDEDGSETAYAPQLLSATDYFPFGMQMPGRVVSSPEGYRYGFNGMEKENAVNQDGYDFGARLYNSWNGKFLSIDPDFRKYPFQSTYCFANNTPIYAIDKNGRGAEIVTDKNTFTASIIFKMHLYGSNGISKSDIEGYLNQSNINYENGKAVIQVPFDAGIRFVIPGQGGDGYEITSITIEIDVLDSKEQAEEGLRNNDQSHNYFSVYMSEPNAEGHTRESYNPSGTNVGYFDANHLIEAGQNVMLHEGWHSTAAIYSKAKTSDEKLGNHSDEVNSATWNLYQGQNRVTQKDIDAWGKGDKNYKGKTGYRHGFVKTEKGGRGLTGRKANTLIEKE